MSKLVKGFLIAACVCIVLGIAVLGGVAVTGGFKEVYEVMEDGGVVFSDDGFKVGSTVVLGDIADVEITSANGKEHTYQADEIENLDIELEAGVFEIKEGDTDQIMIRATKDVNVSSSGNSISIETPERWVVFGFGHKDAQKVEITLPKGKEFHTIDLEVGAGELNADTLACEELVLELGAGRVEMDNCLCESGEISVGAGEVIIKEGTAKELDLDVGMGDFRYKGSVSGDLDADCGMGNMDIQISGQESDYNYQIDCGMGDISIGATSYGGVASSKEIDNDASADFDLDCGMGNISIVFE